MRKVRLAAVPEVGGRGGMLELGRRASMVFVRWGRAVVLDGDV